MEHKLIDKDDDDDRLKQLDMFIKASIELSNSSINKNRIKRLESVILIENLLY